MKIQGRGRSAQSSSHTDSHEHKQRRLASCQGFIQTCQDTPSFLDCIFPFPKAETSLKERGFRMLRALTETWWQNFKLFLQMPLLNIFQNFLNYSINVFKLRRLLWIVIIHFFISFFLFFHISICQILYIMQDLCFSVLVMNITIFSETTPWSALIFDGLSDVISQKKELIK
jgi:hypothetical protein